jgi:hypothetical protein
MEFWLFVVLALVVGLCAMALAFIPPFQRFGNGVC